MSPVTHVELRPGAYADSVALLQVSRAVQQVPGVLAAQVAMATQLNLDVLVQMGFEIPDSTANDMVVAVRADDDDAIAAALVAVTTALAPASRGGDAPTDQAPPRTTATAVRERPGALVLVSVPGASAFLEAMDALEAGCDVMVFSDNVPLDQELALKQAAASRGALVMGPDCGTSVVGGLGLGFANAVAPGPVGLVAASGTGCQQLLALLAYAGIGVADALGVGGRDLSTTIGGLSTREALRRLDVDPAVELVVVVSKPPAEEVAAALRQHAAGLGTPVHFALLGAGQPDLTAAAEETVAALGRPPVTWPTWGDPATSADGPLLRGLFVGGTLCDEAMLVVGATLGPVHSNIPLAPGLGVDGSLEADGHVLLDFGDDALTQGRAHPMIDPTLRLEHLARVAADPRTGVLLLDVVLGHGAEPDPAALLAPAIAAARRQRDLPVLVTCVGTEDDPQGLTRQATALAAAGAEVHLSNAAAARRAAALLGGVS